MLKDKALNALRLVEYVSSLDNFVLIKESFETYDHMGAILADAVLQAGMSYKSVVAPRVKQIIMQYPHARTTSKFLTVLEENGANTILNWNHPEKPRRLYEITKHFNTRLVDTEEELRGWLCTPHNSQSLLKLKGIGPKTIDYLKNLVDISTVAVDRHVRNFVLSAGITQSEYEEIRTIVELAADFLEVRSSWLDRSIWVYMTSISTQPSKSNRRPCRLH